VTGYRSILVVLLLVAGGVCRGPRTASAQPAPDRVITTADVQPLARFDDATALAIDPAGRLYVTDAGPDAVVQLAANGTVEARYGGPGTQPGAFDAPEDLDATNGLAIYVADAGNSRIQRFARAFQFLEALPVGAPSGTTARPTYDRQTALADATGTPIAVAVSDTDELYVIDAAERQVVRWGPRRRVAQAIGGFDAGPGALREPAALALGSDGRLFVADRARDAIVVFDAFGTWITTFAEGLAADAQALHVADDTLWLVGPDAVQHVSPTGRLDGRWSVRLGAPLVDAVQHTGRTYFLTPERLFVLLAS